jgi:hypothetical protein
MEQRENAGYDLLVDERCAGRRSRAVQTAPGRPAPARGPFFWMWMPSALAELDHWRIHSRPLSASKIEFNGIGELRNHIRNRAGVPPGIFRLRPQPDPRAGAVAFGRAAFVIPGQSVAI